MEESSKTIDIQSSIDEVTARFADATNVSTDGEGVKLYFIQNVAVQTGKITSGRCVGAIYLTWPHVIRLSDLFQRIIAENREKVTAHYNQSFASAEKNNDGKE